MLRVIRSYASSLVRNMLVDTLQCGYGGCRTGNGETVRLAH